MAAPATRLTIQSRITCPHCWHEFAPEESLWIAEHPDLVGDTRLGELERVRFLPSRFSADGDALDPEGQRSSRLACPECHLEIPRPMYQIAPVFFSILGAPACGKSYFLASMTWNMRQLLPNEFGIAMTDTDPVSNARLHEYEETQFLNPNPDKLVSIAKTDLQGDLYDIVKMGTHNVVYPKPFLFNLQPLPEHPHHSRSRSVSRIMCLYDNAGESFLPGEDKATNPVTRHLALSRCSFFLFDPTQNARFRMACEGKSDDPQMQPRTERLARENSVRQDTILLEAIKRVRLYAGLREDEQHQRPLIIVVTKWDSWRALTPELSNDPPYKAVRGLKTKVLDQEKIEFASKTVETLLNKFTPELVAAARGFAKDLMFLPVSATGRAPEFNDDGVFGIRPRDMAPYWVEVPMLAALSRWCSGLVGSSSMPGKASNKASGANDDR